MGNNSRVTPFEPALLCAYFLLALCLITGSYALFALLLAATAAYFYSKSRWRPAAASQYSSAKYMPSRTPSLAPVPEGDEESGSPNSKVAENMKDGGDEKAVQPSTGATSPTPPSTKSAVAAVVTEEKAEAPSKATHPGGAPLTGGAALLARMRCGNNLHLPRRCYASLFADSSAEAGDMLLPNALCFSKF